MASSVSRAAGAAATMAKAGRRAVAQGFSPPFLDQASQISSPRLFSGLRTLGFVFDSPPTPDLSSHPLPSSKSWAWFCRCHGEVQGATCARGYFPTLRCGGCSMNSWCLFVCLLLQLKCAVCWFAGSGSSLSIRVIGWFAPCSILFLPRSHLMMYMILPSCLCHLPHALNDGFLQGQQGCGQVLQRLPCFLHSICHWRHKVCSYHCLISLLSSPCHNAGEFGLTVNVISSCCKWWFLQGISYHHQQLLRSVTYTVHVISSWCFSIKTSLLSTHSGHN